MGLCDVFGKEDRVDITISQLIDCLASNANLKAKNDILLTGFKKHIDYDIVLALLNEESEKPGTVELIKSNFT